jgi:C4-dicarboxylate-specific signal transduction histidine kinase
MGIMGNAQLAILNCGDKKAKEKLERIIDLSERGGDITGNLMSFSKDHEPRQTHFKIEDKIDLVLKMLEKDLTGINPTTSLNVL